MEGAAQPRSCLQHGWAGDCSLFYISKVYYGFVLIINVPLSPHLRIKPSPFVRGCSLKGGGRPVSEAARFLPPLLLSFLPPSPALPFCLGDAAGASQELGIVVHGWQHQHEGPQLSLPGDSASLPAPGSRRGAKVVSLPVLELFSVGMR